MYNPKITCPHHKTVWTAGQHVTFTWDTSGIPEDYKGTGKLILGWLTHDSSNEHLQLDEPLHENFLLTDGFCEATLPHDLPTRHSYIVVLMGNSGNASPKFTINAC